MLINRNDEFFDDSKGRIIRVLEKHFDAFEVETSDEYDEETQRYINFKPQILTRSEIRKIAKAAFIVWEDEQ